MNTFEHFPQTRLRRMRNEAWSRALVRETVLAPQDLIWPVFVTEGQNQRVEVASLPGVFRLSIDVLLEEAQKAQALGIPCIALFPCVEPSLKTPDAQEAYNPESLACRAIRALKKTCPDLGVMVDVALDLYTTHGHDGLLIDDHIVNDPTLEVLVKQAMIYAESGVDAVGPSDMMDGRIGAIRRSLETGALHDTRIFAYSAKYASALYGPYRDAVGSAAQLGTGSKASKQSYQQDPANRRESLREVALDIQEGADMIMIKPASLYLDVIHQLSQTVHIPLLAYQVSGEYAMIQAGAQKGWINGPAVMHESLLAIKRAGCSGILTYAALEVAQIIAKS
jgi:porphobilinogen synthase